MLERELEVVQLTKGRGHREEAMFKCASVDMITISKNIENKFTSEHRQYLNLW